IETAKANQLEPYAYLKQVFTLLPNAESIEDADQLLPWNVTLQLVRRLRFTAIFEALVIDWLKEASISAVSRLMGLSWNAIDDIMQRAVKRRLARREEINPTHIGVDETAFRKRYDYVTVVSDQDTGTVLHVGKERKKATLKECYSSLTEEQREAIESVSINWSLPLSTPHWKAYRERRRRLPLTNSM
ncbi:MAG: transposase domain-containing protein, partial [Candidatus Thiodiazotropha sp. (ex Lucinoma aequizonata)]|nr:transposase domain-containing protein [Candidatus Thiodiazotropha sp. (ex Lucinoma aequizonata)]MCU7901035.1 transposase domain-containing protein [Candidatus Thiodiazotropha sp. (ex Lucinoma aequizonata)]MCU7913837.1 transposase domain-containing protein [Candidatus Thiodiazotropha sp. (ex Lucinoma aequizonata)]